MRHAMVMEKHAFPEHPWAEPPKPIWFKNHASSRIFSLFMNACLSGASPAKKGETEKGRTSQPEVVCVPGVVRAVEGSLAGPPSVLPRAIRLQYRHADRPLQPRLGLRYRGQRSAPNPGKPKDGLRQTPLRGAGSGFRRGHQAFGGGDVSDIHNVAAANKNAPNIDFRRRGL